MASPEIKEILSKLGEQKRTALDEQEKNARAMGSFWRDARQNAEMDPLEVALKLGIPYSDIGMIELGGKAEDRTTLWTKDTPRNIANALGKPELYSQFCEQFNIPPYEESDNHKPKENTKDTQSYDNSPYQSAHLKQRH